MLSIKTNDKSTYCTAYKNENGCLCGHSEQYSWGKQPPSPKPPSPKPPKPPKPPSPKPPSPKPPTDWWETMGFCWYRS